jgi:HPt (histidine-containing phosphotransfer) domain-containing protein
MTEQKMAQPVSSTQSDAIFSREEMLNSAQEILATYARAYRIELPKIFAQMKRCSKGLADPEQAAASLSLLKRDAHDMKGQGAMFGLPALSVAAGDFWRVLNVSEPNAANRPAIDKYIKALERLAKEPVETMPISDQT